MKPRERVLATLEGKPVDRPPVDIWYTQEVLAALIEANREDLLKVVPDLVVGRAKSAGSPNIHREGVAAQVALWRVLGLDKIATVAPDYAGATRPLAEGTDHANPWGCLMKYVKSGESEYLEYAGAPLAGMEEPEELEDYPWWPDPEAFDLSPIHERLEADGDEFATNGPWISLFEVYCGMRGLEEAMIDMLANPGFLTAALDRIESIQTRLVERVMTEGPRRPDLVFVSDDMASQENLFCSLDTWDTHIGPRLKRWCGLIHSHGSRVFYHSDGAVEPLIPRLIEAGIDVLNPLQHQCPGMDLVGLREKYGERLAFHGGVDTQGVLPFGTPADVRRETLHCLESMRGARFICASCHNVQAGTPVENIMALIETVRGWS